MSVRLSACNVLLVKTFRSPIDFNHSFLTSFEMVLCILLLRLYLFVFLTYLSSNENLLQHVDSTLLNSKGFTCSNCSFAHNKFLKTLFLNTFVVHIHKQRVVLCAMQ